MRDLDEILEERGGDVGAPPLILGHRGAPRLAPENTLSSLRRALELGLDGIEYDVQASADLEPVLLHDDTVTRTTDGAGPISAMTMAELTSLDAGSWFGKAFTAEPLPLLEEALELDRAGQGDAPLHMIELKRPDLVPRVARALANLPRPLPVRVASFYREVCLEARDQGLPSMLLAVRANGDDLAFVRDERIQAHGLAAFGWRNDAGRLDWPCERWAWSVDSPRDLLEACRAPLFGFNTNEPLRARAVRALVSQTPGDRGAYPLEVPELPLRPGTFSSKSFESGGGEWTGEWEFEVRVRNPFDQAAEVELFFRSRRGAFEIDGGRTNFSLAPGETRAAALRLAGGSWSPGLEPLLGARFERAAGVLVLDAPLERVRLAQLHTHASRFECLRESPRARPATISGRRQGHEVRLEIESAGGLDEAQLAAHLDGETVYGGQRLALRLPRDFDQRAGGVPFSCGLVGREPDTGALIWRRWSGGLPSDLLSGTPGRLLPAR